MASTAGSYIGADITKLSVGLAHTLVYDQCMASTTGGYIDIEITKLPVWLGDTLV
jgi:hypothetical protein